MYRIDVDSGRLENLTPHEGDVIFDLSDVSPDGKTLLITSNEKGGYENVALLDVGTRNRTWVTETKWEAHSGDFSPAGTNFYYILNADGRTEIFLVSLPRLRAEKLTFAEGISAWSAEPSVHVCYHSVARGNLLEVGAAALAEDCIRIVTLQAARGAEPNGPGA